MTDEQRLETDPEGHRPEGHDPERPEDQSLGGLLSEVARDVSELIRKEVELAKLEVREEAVKASKAGAKLGAAALMGNLAFLLAAFALAWGLAEVMPAGWAFLVVAVIAAAVAGGLFAVGRKQFREVSPVPRQTGETLKEDVEWARERMS
ncbi:Putative Holin-X, holin superfamily III [Glycomyces sambucus]|uniref:Putative Holin-X, holin superfamily III n=1 Tax=Glycomyces sambucus TaxID=380244 RepID=A0A1G9DAI9_9ACTN|nr:phage holin family protein [Glycomyces sambucus]SDK60901.1 Putative Holin-X, holin superfamily III [Glycomyces sambucus]